MKIHLNKLLFILSDQLHLMSSVTMTFKIVCFTPTAIFPSSNKLFQSTLIVRQSKWASICTVRDHISSHFSEAPVARTYTKVFWLSWFFFQFSISLPPYLFMCQLYYTRDAKSLFFVVRSRESRVTVVEFDLTHLVATGAYLKG